MYWTTELAQGEIVVNTFSVIHLVAPNCIAVAALALLGFDTANENLSSPVQTFAVGRKEDDVRSNDGSTTSIQFGEIGVVVRLGVSSVNDSCRGLENVAADSTCLGIGIENVVEWCRFDDERENRCHCEKRKQE